MCILEVISWYILLILVICWQFLLLKKQNSRFHCVKFVFVAFWLVHWESCWFTIDCSSAISTTNTSPNHPPVSKKFNLKTILKCQFFYCIFFCSICILIGCLLVLLFFSQTNLLYGYIVLYMLWFVLDFVKLYLFVNYWNLCRITDLSVLWWYK